MKKHLLQSIASLAALIIFLLVSPNTAQAQEYCATAGAPEYEYITGVSFSGIENTSEGAAYSDFTEHTAQVIPGVSYDMTVQVFRFYPDPEYATVYVDWDQDGIFSPDELYNLGFCNSDAGCAAGITGAIDVPANAVPGETRMRVIVTYGSPREEPCGNFGGGEAEDYTVNVNAGECTPPNFQYVINNDCENETYSVAAIINDYGTNTFVSVAFTRSDGVSVFPISIPTDLPEGYVFELINDVPFGVTVSAVIQGENPICNLNRTWQALICPADNDIACEATELTCGETKNGLSFNGATESFTDNCFGEGTNDVWFTFTSDGTEKYKISETSGLDVIIDLWEGDDCAALNNVYPCQDFPEEFTVEEAGTYYFRVRPYFANTTDMLYNISLECIPFDCPDLLVDFGLACDDGNPDTYYDVINQDCECAGVVPVPGQLCETSIDVDALPFTATGNTQDYFDDYGSADMPLLIGAGGITNGQTPQFYLNGNDVVYSYTPDANQSIDISVTNHGNYTGVFVFKGCPFDVTLGYSVDYMAATALEINGLIAEAGETYYIVISTYADPQVTSFTLNIEAGPFDCPLLEKNIGSPCDDGNPDSYDDIVSADCECEGWTPDPGQICQVPLEITGLPYITTDNTVNYGNNYTAANFAPLAPGAIGTPSSSYLQGSDVVYAYTPAQNEVVKATVSNHVAYTGIYVFTGCPFGSTVGGHTLYSATDNLEVSGLSLQAGVTYYFVISTWSAGSTPYTFKLETFDFDCTDLEANYGNACTQADDTPGELNADCECVELSCANTAKYPNAATMVSNVVTTISTVSSLYEYSVVTGIEAGEDYEFTAGNGYITVRTGNANGAVVAQGYSPLTVTAPNDENLFAHWNVDDECTTNFSSVTTTVQCVSCLKDCPDLNLNFGEVCDDNNPDTGNDTVNEDCECVGILPGDCVNTAQYPAYVVTASNILTTITTWTTLEQYTQIDGIEEGEEYEFTITGNGYITVRSGTFDGAVIGHGYSPVTVTAPNDDNLFAHWNVNEYCDTEWMVSLATTVQCISCSKDCPDLDKNIGDSCDDGNPLTSDDTITADCECEGSLEGECQNTTMYPSSAIEANQTVTVIATCNWLEEYGEISGIEAGMDYEFTVTGNGWITVRSGSAGGTVIGTGYESVTVTAANNNNLFVHWNADDNCNTGTGCVITTVQCTTCPKDCPDLDMNFGETCDDGNPLTYGDIVLEDCTCQGIVPIPGEICEAPIVVESLPYLTTDNTSDYLNDYNGSDAPALAPGAVVNGFFSSYYLNGDDVVYAYTSETNQAINIKVSGTDAYSGVFVFTGCPFEATHGYANTTSANTNFTIDGLIVQADVTYYIVISTYPNPINTAYTLEITLGEFDCTDLELNIGSPCDDGNPDTYDDVVTADCECLGWSPIPGQLCELPLEITSFPFTMDGNTANYFDNYGSGNIPPLAPNAITSGTSHTFYLNGDEVVYGFTAVNNAPVNISLTNIGSEYAGMFVFTGCEFASTVAYALNEYSTGPLEIIGLPVEIGETYYIVISTWAAPQSTSYTLNVDQPEFDCPAIEAFIGDACDDGNPETVNDKINANCDCVGDIPPSGSFCESAIPVECNEAPNAYNSAPSTATNTTECGMGSKGLWFSFEGTGDDITVTTTATFNHRMSINSGMCDDLTSLACVNDGVGAESYLISESAEGQMYYVYVADWSSTGSSTGTVTIKIECEETSEAGCVNTYLWPNTAVEPNGDGSDTSIDDCNFPGDYSMVGGVVTGNEYEFTAVIGESTAGYITVREGAADGPVVGAGNSPLTVTALSDATLFAHWNTDESCATSYDCTVTSVSCVTCATLNDCEGVAGGPAQPGSACDDGNPDTVNDTWNADCECVGIVPGPGSDCAAAIVVDCNADPATYSSVGSTATNTTNCDLAANGLWFTFVGDGNNITFKATTTFDHVISMNSGDCEMLFNNGCIDSPYGPNEEKTYLIENSIVGENYYVYIADYSFFTQETGDITVSLVCETQPYDCPDLSANIGDDCDVTDPTTENGVVTPDCECVGTTIVVYDCPELEANIGDACDDQDESTQDDVITEDCECAGTPIVVYDCPELEVNFGDACDDGDDTTENDEYNTDCECVGTPIVVEVDCPNLGANIGDACSDDLIENGIINDDCECEPLVSTINATRFTFNMYPNPAGQSESVTLTSEQSINRYEVLDITGKLIEAKSISNQNEIKIALRNYSSGLYILKAYSGSDFSTRKMVVR